MTPFARPARRAVGPRRRVLGVGLSAVLVVRVGAAPVQASTLATTRATPTSAAATAEDVWSGSPTRGGRVDVAPRAGEQRYIVRTDGTSALDRVAARLADLGVTMVDRFEHALTAVVVNATPGRADALRHLPGVTSVTATVPVRATGDVAAQGTQTFSLGTGLWGLDRIDQRSSSLNGRFDYANAGVGVTAYVLDTGLHVSHTEFRGRVSLGRSYFVPFDGDTSGIDDCFGHGTGVAGVLGGTSTGVAKGVTIVPVKVLDCAGHGDDSTVIAGIDHVIADHAAGAPAVANFSLAGPYSAPLNAAVQALIDDGVTAVIASGNSGADACTFSPGSLSTAITVGSTSPSDVESSFSNAGRCVDMFAP
ncbi:MAG: S8 family peptidase, partial [Ilumatobacteraceae bacterium]